MAETPKDEKKTDAEARETATSTSIKGADPAPEGGGASPAEDSIASGGDPAADTSDDDTVSADTAADHITGGAGDDVIAGGAPGRPWSKPEIDGDDRSPAPQATAAKSEAQSGAKASGGRRFLVPLILILLILGVGYATYPDWRDQAAPYAAAIGLDLPSVPVEAEDADTQSTDVSSAPTPDSGDSTGDAAPTPAPTVEPAAPSTASSAELESLAARVSAAETALARLSDAEPAAPAGVTEDLAALMERVQAVEARLATVGDELAILRQGLGESDGSAGVAEATTALTGRLADLDARLTALEQAAAAPTASPEDLAAVSTRIDSLSSALDARTGDLAGRLDALASAQQDIAARQEAGRDARERAGAFLLATNLLAATSAGSGDFSAELNAVETAADADAGEAVAALKEHVGGVPSRTDLRVRFPAVAASIIDASVVGADGGVVGTALTRIASLVTLRRTETADGDAIDAIVNRAEAAANAGDLAAAVEALASLDGDPAKVAAPWLAQARARIAVDAAVRALQSKALSAVSGG